MDFSSNRIAQDVAQIFQNMPPTLEKSNLSNNTIEGILPKEFPMKKALFFFMSNNRMSGPLPYFTNTSPKLKHLDLANNDLTGTIHGSFVRLDGLNVLDLSGNKLSGSIPASLGDLSQLNILKLSSNSLSHSIPVKLGRLKGKCVCH